MVPDDVTTVTADELDDAGAGVGDAGGVRVHAVDLLPGERGNVVIDHVSNHRPEAWGRCVERLGPASPDRVAPPCPAWGACGGCAWQHLAYPAQLERKRLRVEAALGHAAEPVVPAPAELGYRNKGKYVIGEVAGALTLGAYKPRTHELVDTLGCRHVVPAIDRAAAQVRDALAGSGLPAYDERARTGVWRYLVARADDAGRVLAHLVTSTAVDHSAIESVATALVGDPIVGVSWAAHDRTEGVILGGEPVSVAGEPALVEHLSGVDVPASATAFLQVNRAQAERIYRDLADAAGAGPDTPAVDLYCGIGGIAFALAARGASVLAIEADADAVAHARRAGDERVRFVHATAAELTEVVAPPVALLSVNPPRKGLDAATRAAVIELAPDTIAYLSCNPTSLGRDLAELTRAGYAIEKVAPYDLMPGTAQVETLVILRRG